MAANISKSVIAAASRRIFGQLPVTEYKVDVKHLRAHLKGPVIADYYQHNMAKAIRGLGPEFRQYLGSEKEDLRQEKLAYDKERGKGKPKKGAGKRAAKRKK